MALNLSDAPITKIETSHPNELSPSTLRRACDVIALGFKTTDELPRLQSIIGQPRAFRALELGSAVAGQGFNIFVLGLPDSGRTTLSRSYLEGKAAADPVPDDWCYVNNFENPLQPKSLRLPAGRAKEFRIDMQAMITRCEQEIPRAFESEEYTRERDRMLEELKSKRETEFERLAQLASKYNFTLARSPFGFALIPSVGGKPLTPEEVEQLSTEQLSKLTQLEATLREKVEQSLESLRDLERTSYEHLQELNSRTALFVVEHLIEGIKAKYAELEQVVRYLDNVKADIVTNTDQFRSRKAHPGNEQADTALYTSWLRRYGVNVVVDNSGSQGAPVVIESQPSYHNLLGRIEHEFVMGAASTDFTLIRPGALHRANGGYLILPARDVLLNPYAWDGLKRVLRDGAIRIIELGTRLSLVSTSTLEPEPIPLTTKVVLIGTPLLYYMLSAYDEDFAKLFKVKAEFANSMDRTPDTEREYALFVKSVQDDNHLLPFASGAVARIIEYGSRLAEDQSKLSTRFGKIADLIREASYWAGKEGESDVTTVAVERTLDESTYRSNLLEDRVRTLISQGTLAINITGKAVGQVNALSVVMLGDYAFGHPTRVTASARPGQGGVLDIERRAELGGPIHTKGILILGGCLGERYGRKRPLSLAASIAFEQSYQGVEGDSASAAELFALLSAIAGIPLRQDIAVTGSINQHGLIQAIGGVNEKIEGFFSLCSLKGFTGSQGVIIPESNIRHLMLREEVIEAVASGQFHIWPISTVDNGLSLLTGVNLGNGSLTATFQHSPSTML